ncbi:hypothetical protein J7L85_03280 [candidate division WOR-3 bacterium]|nr:hypothetical protein [candidate division WOR-3 bacterium]
MLLVFPKPKKALRHPAFLVDERIGLTAKLNISIPNPSERIGVLEKGYYIDCIRNRPVVKLLRGRPKIRLRSVKWARDLIIRLLEPAVLSTNRRLKPIEVWNAVRDLSMYPTYGVVLTNRRAYTLDTTPRPLTVNRFLLWGYILFLFA